MISFTDIHSKQSRECAFGEVKEPKIMYVDRNAFKCPISIVSLREFRRCVKTANARDASASDGAVVVDGQETILDICILHLVEHYSIENAQIRRAISFLLALEVASLDHTLWNRRR